MHISILLNGIVYIIEHDDEGERGDFPPPTEGVKVVHIRVKNFAKFGKALKSLIEKHKE